MKKLTISLTLVIIYLIILITPLNAQTWELYRFDIKTNQLNQVTFTDNYYEFDPDLSRDGKKLSYRAMSTTTWQSEVLVLDLKSGDTKKIQGIPNSNKATLSPDGKYYAYDSNNNLYVIQSQGGSPKLLLENCINSDWSKHSNRILTFDRDEIKLITVNIFDPTDIIEVITISDMNNVVTWGPKAKWSHDGKWIIYWQNNHIYKIRVSHDGKPLGEEIKVSQNESRFDCNPSWSKNGKTIVYTSCPIEDAWPHVQADIWIMDHDGSNAHKVSGNPYYGDWEPIFDGNRYIYYATIAYPVEGSFKSHPTVLSKKNSDNYTIHQNYPNPFNPTTRISYSIPEETHVCLKVYNSIGEKVATLINENKEAGIYEAEFNATKLPSGIYFYTIQTGQFSETKKMILLR